MKQDYAGVSIVVDGNFYTRLSSTTISMFKNLYAININAYLLACAHLTLIKGALWQTLHYEIAMRLSDGMGMHFID